MEDELLSNLQEFFPNLDFGIIWDIFLFTNKDFRKTESLLYRLTREPLIEAHSTVSRTSHNTKLYHLTEFHDIVDSSLVHRNQSSLQCVDTQPIEGSANSYKQSTQHINTSSYTDSSVPSQSSHKLPRQLRQQESNDPTYGEDAYSRSLGKETAAITQDNESHCTTETRFSIKTPNAVSFNSDSVKDSSFLARSDSAQPYLDIIDEVMSKLPQYNLNYSKEFIFYFLEHHSKLKKRDMSPNEILLEIRLASCCPITGLQPVFETWLKRSIEPNSECVIENDSASDISLTPYLEPLENAEVHTCTNLPFIRSLYEGVVTESVVDKLWKSYEGDAGKVIAVIENQLQGNEIANPYNDEVIQVDTPPVMENKISPWSEGSARQSKLLCGTREERGFMAHSLPDNSEYPELEGIEKQYNNSNPKTINRGSFLSVLRLNPWKYNRNKILSILTSKKLEHLIWCFPAVSPTEIEFTLTASDSRLDSAAKLLVEEHLTKLRPKLVEEANQRMNRHLQSAVAPIEISLSGDEKTPQRILRGYPSDTSLEEYVKIILGHSNNGSDDVPKETEHCFQVFRGHLLNRVCQDLSHVYPDISPDAIKDFVNSHQRRLREEDHIRNSTSIAGMQKASLEDREVFSPSQLKDISMLQEIQRFSRTFVESLICITTKSIQEVLGCEPCVTLKVTTPQPNPKAVEFIKEEACVLAIVRSFKEKMRENPKSNTSDSSTCLIKNSHWMYSRENHIIRNPPDTSIPLERTPRRQLGILRTIEKNKKCEVLREPYYTLLRKRNILLKNFVDASSVGNIRMSSMYRSECRSLDKLATDAKILAARKIFSLHNPDIIWKSENLSLSNLELQPSTCNTLSFESCQLGSIESQRPSEIPFALIDLHGLLVEEALFILSQQLQHCKEKAERYCLILGGRTGHGRGLHSRREGISMLRHAVQEYLEQQTEFKWRFGRGEGIFLVRVCKLRLTSTECN